MKTEKKKKCETQVNFSLKENFFFSGKIVSSCGRPRKKIKMETRAGSTWQPG